MRTVLMSIVLSMFLFPAVAGAGEPSLQLSVLGGSSRVSTTSPRAKLVDYSNVRRLHVSSIEGGTSKQTKVVSLGGRTYKNTIRISPTWSDEDSHKQTVRVALKGKYGGRSFERSMKITFRR